MNRFIKFFYNFETFKLFLGEVIRMVDLKWDGAVDSEDIDSELSEVNEQISKKKLDETVEEDDSSTDTDSVNQMDTESTEDSVSDDKLERLNELADGKDSQACLHEWENVSREEMERVVSGEVIDSKDVYWCSKCKSILDTITS
jgi:hypothetical protein